MTAPALRATRPPAQSDLAIEAHGLVKRFKRLRGYRDLALYPFRERSIVALDGVDLRVRSGELFGLLGQNGAGKTTLIRILSTTLLPSAGQASVGGFDVVRQAAEVRGRIGLAQADERSFYWRLTGRQNLEYFAALFHVEAGLARERVERLLDLLDLREQAETPFQAMSTGTRHKFGIIRALLGEPRILFLDEPTRSLDPISASIVRRFVREHVVGELGTTVVLATHSLAEAEALCDRLAVVHRGRIVAGGTPGELRARFAREAGCLIEVRAPAPAIAQRLGAVPGVAAVRSEERDGVIRLDVTFAPTGSLRAVLAGLLAADVEVVSVADRQPTLEDVYLRTLAEPSSADRPASVAVAGPP